MHIFEGWWDEATFISGRRKRKRDQRVSSLQCPSLGISGWPAAEGMPPYEVIGI